MVAALEGNVTIPGFGSQKKQTVAVVGGAAVIFLGVAYTRHRNSGGGTGTDTAATTDPTSIDPATGYSYGSAEDAQALAAQTAYQTPQDYGYGGGVAGGGITTGGDGTTNPPAVISTNSQWTQAAISYLSESVGLSSTAVSGALGKYVTGTSVDASEKAIVNQAIAAVGFPPVTGPNGYPPHIREHAAGPTKRQLTPPPKVTSRNISKTHARLSWSATPNAKSYRVFREGHKSEVVAGRSVTVPRPGTYYVVAENPLYYSSANSPLVTV